MFSFFLELLEMTFDHLDMWGDEIEQVNETVIDVCPIGEHFIGSVLLVEQEKEVFFAWQNSKPEPYAVNDYKYLRSAF